MQTRTFSIIVLALAVLAIPFVSCSASPSLELQQHSIVVKELTGDVERSSAIVSGKIKNIGSLTEKGCIVSADFYGNNNDIIATVKDKLDVLNSGEAWNFKLQLNGSDAWKVVRYEIRIGD